MAIIRCYNLLGETAAILLLRVSLRCACVLCLVCRAPSCSSLPVLFLKNWQVFAHKTVNWLHLSEECNRTLQYNIMVHDALATKTTSNITIPYQQYCQNIMALNNDIDFHTNSIVVYSRYHSANTRMCQVLQSCRQIINIYLMYWQTHRW
jgi:hypothetical protein